MSDKTRTFIGSSSEGLAVANAIAANLAEDTVCQVWTDRVFLPGRTFIETLERLVHEVDYAVLVASPDDVLGKRDVENFSMRDNVLLELGLFMAKLGRSRTYLVTPTGAALHIPSDLLGLQTVTYDHLQDAAEAAWTEAMSEPCDTIRLAMQKADEEMSLATKRLLVRRILLWTTRVHEVLVTLQAKCFKAVLDREEFGRLKEEVIAHAEELVAENSQDAARLDVGKEYEALAEHLREGLQTLPFPEELTVTQGDVVGGVMGHLFGKTSVKDLVGQRVQTLLARYSEWWDGNSKRLSKDLLDLQSALIRLI